MLLALYDQKIDENHVMFATVLVFIIGLSKVSVCYAEETPTADDHVIELLRKGDYESASRELGLTNEEFEDLKFKSDFNLDGRLSEEEQLTLIRHLVSKLQLLEKDQEIPPTVKQNEKPTEQNIAKKTSTESRQWWKDPKIISVTVGALVIIFFFLSKKQTTPTRNGTSRQSVQNQVRSSWEIRKAPPPANKEGSLVKAKQHVNQINSIKQTATVLRKSDKVSRDVNKDEKRCLQDQDGSDNEHSAVKKSFKTHGGNLKQIIPASSTSDGQHSTHSKYDDTEKNASKSGKYSTTKTEQLANKTKAAAKESHSMETAQNEISDIQYTVKQPEQKLTREETRTLQDTAKHSEPELTTEETRTLQDTAKHSEPELTTEEISVQLLSKLLEVKLEMKSATNKNSLPDLNKLIVEEKELPLVGNKDCSEKTSAIFKRRLLRVFVDKIKFCSECHERCSQIQENDRRKQDIVRTIQSCAAEEIVKQLVDNCSSSDKEEDDIWSSFTSGEQSTGHQFLCRLAGWSHDGMSISDDLLREILCKAADNKHGFKAIGSLITIASDQIRKVKRLDEIMLSESAMLTALQVLTEQKEAGKVLSNLLINEVKESSNTLGLYFEKTSVFAKLLSLSTIPVPGNPLRLDRASAQPYLELRGFPQMRQDDLKSLESQLQQVFHKVQQIVYSSIHNILKSDREIALAWLSSVVMTNESRQNVNQQLDAQAFCTDGYMVNFCTVLLTLCQPFCQDLTKLDKIDPCYATSKSCRLNYDYENCLAGSQIVSEDSSSHTCLLPEDMQGKYNFITECFYLTQKALHVGIIPSISHMLNMQKNFLYVQEIKKGTPEEQDVRKQRVLVTLLWDCCLVDYELLRNTSEFYLTQAAWYMKLLQDSSSQDNFSSEEIEKKQRNVLSQIPEFPVKDMCIWFKFVTNAALQVHPNALVNLRVSDFVDCCVLFLQRTDLVPGPITASKIVSALLSFVETSKRRNQRAQGWGSDIMSDYAAMVHTNSSVQCHLGPVLIDLYSRVDVVEGLDVDKEEFDKYGARLEIGKLMENLWTHHDCRVSVLKRCGTGSFQAFLGSLLDTLLYQYHDSLARLANVRKLQDAKENEAEWNSLSNTERKEKEQFLHNEERVAKGFMAMTNATLNLIDLVTKSEKVSACFTKKPLAQRAASTIIGMLESLCGAKAVELKVKDMQKYNFNPRQLLLQIIELILRISQEETSQEHGFVVSIAKDPDYNAKTLNKAVSILHREGLGDPDISTKWGQLVTKLSSLELTVSSQNATAKHGEETYDWLQQLQEIVIDNEQLEKKYIENMRSETFDATDLVAYHSFNNKAKEPLDPRSPKTKALMKEVRQLSENLPVHPNAAIFVRQDEERMDIVRAVITGPTDTPYSLGCFVFDIYFPDQYPMIPPVVKLITTGNGTVRFNPNLYADGKVCLSLLGTWHGSSATEKWNPKSSSLYQVLVSIQSMILISDPMYNEPGYEGMRGTTEGEGRSVQYNGKLQLWTIRHAMLGQLSDPPTGSEAIIRKHFLLQRKSVLKQCSDWLKQCQDDDIRRRLIHAIQELKESLMKLKEDNVMQGKKCDESDEA